MIYFFEGLRAAGNHKEDHSDAYLKPLWSDPPLACTGSYGIFELFKNRKFRKSNLFLCLIASCSIYHLHLSPSALVAFAEHSGDKHCVVM